MVDRTEIGHRIKDLMYAKDINQRELGEKLGVSHTTVRNVVLGITKPRYEFIESLLHTYPEINKEWLMEGKGEMFKGAEAKSEESTNTDGGSISDYINSLYERQIAELKQALNNAYYTIELQKKMIEGNFLEPNTGEPKMGIEFERVAA